MTTNTSKAPRVKNFSALASKFLTSFFCGFKANLMS